MLRLATVFAFLTFALAGPVQAESSEASQIFGQSIMSSDEVTAFKTKLANCASDQERAQLQAEHKERMIQRARWKGLVLDRDDKTVTMAGN